MKSDLARNDFKTLVHNFTFMREQIEQKAPANAKNCCFGSPLSRFRKKWP